MLPLLLLAGGVALGITVAIYWKNIKAWLERIWEKLPPIVKDYLQGALAFVRRIGDTVKNIVKYYSYNEETKKWNETVVTQEVDESTIPDHIRRKVQSTSQEVDITDEMEKELSLTH